MDIMVVDKSYRHFISKLDMKLKLFNKNKK